jgi:hypothetical protein
MVLIKTFVNTCLIGENREERKRALKGLYNDRELLGSMGEDASIVFQFIQKINE